MLELAVLLHQVVKLHREVVSVRFTPTAVTQKPSFCCDDLNGASLLTLQTIRNHSDKFVLLQWCLWNSPSRRCAACT